VQYNLKSASMTFSYDPTIQPPVVSSISPASASPVLKGSMAINGLRFGTNISELAVYLTNSTSTVYQLNVLRANDTQLLVKLPGGLPGVFNVIVNRYNYGGSTEGTPNASQFTYEIVMTGVSPVTGSINGGTIITITGRNFSPDPLDNQVYIGNAINWICDIISVTTTQIQCRTPAIHP
jgi:hypothetical protein